MSEEGLRERKRAATRAAIERTAISLALEHGYDQVTVEMICDASMVSQRTFFNYFGSKERAVLGAGPVLPSDENVGAFVRKTGSNVLGDFLALISTSVLDEEPDIELFRARRTLLMGTPELLAKRTASMAEFEDRFVAIILARFEAQGRSARAEPTLEDEARMVASMSNGAMHYVLRKWLSAGAGVSARDLFQDSIELIHRITDTSGS